MAPFRRRKLTVSLVVPFLVFALFFSLMIWQKYRSSSVVTPYPHPLQPEGTRTITLFFAGAGGALVREMRDIEPCEDDNACLKSVLDELINGPVGELGETVPDGAAVEGAHLEGNRAEVDFNQLFSEAMLSGSSAEMVAVYSVVDSIAINFPQVRQVKINIAGNSKAVLHHLDLSDPLQPDFTLERAPSVDPHGGVPVQPKGEGK